MLLAASASNEEAPPTCVARARLLDFLRMKNTSSTMLLVRLPGTCRAQHGTAQHKTAWLVSPWAHQDRK